jgi:uncharacterized protein (TIGR03435 family)
LTGKYDFLFEYTYLPLGSSPANAQPTGVPDVFDALQQQLGLQLLSKKLPFDVVVVESIDKLPTVN